MKNLWIGLLLLAFSSKAQVAKIAADTEFFSMAGGKNFDEGRSIAALQHGGFIVAGTTSSFGEGNTSVYLIKTDTLGKHIWSKTFGGTLNDWAYSVHVTADSGFFIAGYSNSFNSQQNYDPYFLKTDKNGNLLWQKAISGNDWAFLYGATPMPSGGFLLCGKTYINTHGGSDGLLIRINDLGDTLWSKTIGGPSDEAFNSIIVYNSRIYAVGSNNSNRTDSLSDGWAMELDTFGNLLNTRFVTGNHHHSTVLRSVSPATTLSPALYMCGDQTLTDSGSMITVILKADTGLNFTAGPFYGNYTARGNLAGFNQVITTSYNNVCAIGSATGGLGGMNMFFVGYNQNLIWINDFAHDCGGSKDDFGYGLVRANDGKLFGIGRTLSYCAELEDVYIVGFNSDSILNNNIQVADTSCFKDTMALWTSNVKSIAPSDIHCRFFPNPASANLTIELTGNNAGSTHKAQVFNLMGVQIADAEIGNSNERTSAVVDVSGLSPGTYLLKILGSSGDVLLIAKFMVIH